ncbi:MATE family efflux transporter [Thermanaerovibrio acidaminovorans]|uniref:MATE family efflux transporter n=1 Tax=Thermanaerovibrio acidaminovorans TaxID=81462 RepID=UPI0002FFCBCB|nr:MATE family efflux transporter [Thermanaerovibrio acidaminovorans]
MGSEPVGRLLMRLSLPAMVGMFVQATYNMVDALFIGWGVGPLGLAGTAMAFPVQFLAMAFATMGGVGGSSLVSRSIGAGDRETACYAFGNLMWFAWTFGLIMAVGCHLALGQILGLMGASEDVLPHGRAYLEVIIWGFPLIMAGIGMNSTVRAQGRAKLAMATMLVSAGTNVVLDYVFIFPLGMGVRGAALATVISQGVMVVWLMVHFALSGGRMLSIGVRHLVPRWGVLRQILGVGSSEFVRLGASAVVVALVVRSLQRYGSSDAVAAFGVVNRVVALAFMPIIGVGQGLQPILGYNYGAGKMDRAIRAIKLSLLMASGLSTLAFVLMMIFPREIFSLFTPEEALIGVGERTLRTMGLGFPVVGFQVAGTGVFQAMGKGLKSFVLSLSRQVLLFIPLLLVLPPAMGLKGVWLVYPLSDLISAIITGVMLALQLRALGRIEDGKVM